MPNVVKVGPNGEVVLPRQVRADLGLKAGDELILSHDEGGIVLKHSARRFGEYLDTLGRTPAVQQRV